MGFVFGKVWNSLMNYKKDVRILMLGLDNAGKTTVLYKLKVNETVSSIPTIGFNCESIEYKGLNFGMWDVGGQDKIRVLWKHYYNNADGLIFVVDSNDKDRFEEASEELGKLLIEEELQGLPLLVFANKQDLKQSASPDDIVSNLNLKSLKGRPWLVQGTSATSGQGLKEGLDLFAKELLKREKK